LLHGPLKSLPHTRPVRTRTWPLPSRRGAADRPWALGREHNTKLGFLRAAPIEARSADTFPFPAAPLATSYVLACRPRDRVRHRGRPGSGGLHPGRPAGRGGPGAGGTRAEWAPGRLPAGARRGAPAAGVRGGAAVGRCETHGAPPWQGRGREEGLEMGSGGAGSGEDNTLPPRWVCFVWLSPREQAHARTALPWPVPVDKCMPGACAGRV
jgi:hypothetical protein